MTRSTAVSRQNAGNDLFKGMAKKKTKDRNPDTPIAILCGRAWPLPGQVGPPCGGIRGTGLPETADQGARHDRRGHRARRRRPQIAALHDLIDARETSRTDERRLDASSGVSVPSVEEYVEAIRQVTLVRAAARDADGAFAGGRRRADRTTHGQFGGLTSRGRRPNRSFAGGRDLPLSRITSRSCRWKTAGAGDPDGHVAPGIPVERRAARPIRAAGYSTRNFGRRSGSFSDAMTEPDRAGRRGDARHRGPPTRSRRASLRAQQPPQVRPRLHHVPP